MSRFKFAGLTVMAVATLLAGSLWSLARSSGAEPPAPPNRFYGEVFIDGDPAPEGTLILATIGSKVCGRTWVRGDSTYMIDVVSHDQIAGCGREHYGVRFEVPVEFVAPGLPAGMGAWSSGAFTGLDLWVVQGCFFMDDYGRGTKFSIIGSNWRFWGASVDLTGSSGLTWDGDQVYIHTRVGKTKIVGEGRCPSGPATINALHVAPQRPKNFHLVDESSGGIMPWFVPNTPTPAATAVGPTPTPTPPPEGYEAVPLAAGCNPVASTYPDGTSVETVADAVAPDGILVSIWHFEPLLDIALNAWLGYSPEAVQFSDLTHVSLLDTIFVCVGSPGAFVRPLFLP